MWCSPALGPTRLAHPGWEARGMRKESPPGSSWAPTQVAAPAGPPWCSDKDSHKPLHVGGERQIHLNNNDKQPKYILKNIFITHNFPPVLAHGVS